MTKEAIALPSRERTAKETEEQRERRLAQGRQYWADHREERTAKLREYRKAHDDEYRARRPRYKEHELAYSRAYHAEHRTEDAERNSAYKAAHPEYFEQWRVENRERLRAYHRAWYAANREHRLAQMAEYQRTHPEVVREKQARRRAQMLQSPVERISYDAVWARDRGRCRICGRPVSRAAMTLDHIVPIRDGGPHTFLNVQAAHERCNERRQHRGPAQIRLLP